MVILGRLGMVMGGPGGRFLAVLGGGGWICAVLCHLGWDWVVVGCDESFWAVLGRFWGGWVGSVVVLDEPIYN
jgi:hypothetical protein